MEQKWWWFVWTSMIWWVVCLIVWIVWFIICWILLICLFILFILSTSWMWNWRWMGTTAPRSWDSAGSWRLLKGCAFESETHPMIRNEKRVAAKFGRITSWVLFWWSIFGLCAMIWHDHVRLIDEYGAECTVSRASHPVTLDPHSGHGCASSTCRARQWGLLEMRWPHGKQTLAIVSDVSYQFWTVRPVLWTIQNTSFSQPQKLSLTWNWLLDVF